MSELLNKGINFLDVQFWSINRLFFTTYSRIVCALKGIQIGSGCSFYGRTKFKRIGSAHIRFGDRCVFRSSSTSNLIGVDRPCIISALRPNCSITVGANCGFSGTIIGCFKEITIGDHVRCGANTLITDGDWHFDDPRVGPPRSICIQDNVWLGLNVTVLKGVTIGRNSIIGAGSVVVHDIPPNVIAAGNPCKVIRSLELTEVLS